MAQVNCPGCSTTLAEFELADGVHLVVSMPADASQEALEAAGKAMRAVFPDHPILVKPSDVTLEQAAGLQIDELSAEASTWLAERSEEAVALKRFVALMAHELAANGGKGSRVGWMQMDRKEAIGEVHWHASKLAVEAKRLDEHWVDRTPTSTAFDMAEAIEGRAREYAADVANCALMVLDVLGLLEEST